MIDETKEEFEARMIYKPPVDGVAVACPLVGRYSHLEHLFEERVITKAERDAFGECTEEERVDAMGEWMEAEYRKEVRSVR